MLSSLGEFGIMLSKRKIHTAIIIIKNPIYLIRSNSLPDHAKGRFLKKTLNTKKKEHLLDISFLVVFPETISDIF